MTESLAVLLHQPRECNCGTLQIHRDALVNQEVLWLEKIIRLHKFLMHTSWRTHLSFCYTFVQFNERECELIMRSIYAGILKSYFCNQLFSIRNAHGFTQAQMARRLRMEDRSYIELDHGKSCCSALTLALFLIYLCEDPMLFLDELRKAFEEEDSSVA